MEDVFLFLAFRGQEVTVEGVQRFTEVYRTEYKPKKLVER